MGIPLMAESPAPADPAIGVPKMLWADAEADIPTIRASAKPNLLEALDMKNSCQGFLRLRKLGVKRDADRCN
jgi:hypothetical protein